jgi:AcrR family transcriptional regulator
VRPPRSDAARNAEQLVVAARELFNTEGADVALDRVARRAGVGNATLYRNFPTRSDLLIAVYAHEVDELIRHGETLLDSDDPVDALFTWLDALIRHVADKRPLAAAATDGRADLRGELFDRWHTRILTTLDALRLRAHRTTRLSDVSTVDLAALANGLALASSDEEHARRLLLIAREGIVGRT